MERVENNTGEPDVTIAIPVNRVRRVELKAVEEAPKRVSTPLLGASRGLSIDQMNWHRRWNREVGPTYILVALGRGATVAFWTIDGSLADDVNGFTVAEFDEHSLASNWPDFITLMQHIK